MVIDEWAEDALVPVESTSFEAISVELLDGRRALIKDYVLALELELKTTDQIPFV